MEPLVLAGLTKNFSVLTLNTHHLLNIVELISILASLTCVFAFSLRLMDKLFQTTSPTCIPFSHWRGGCQVRLRAEVSGQAALRSHLVDGREGLVWMMEVYLVEKVREPQTLWVHLKGSFSSVTIALYASPSPLRFAGLPDWLLFQSTVWVHVQLSSIPPHPPPPTHH